MSTIGSGIGREATEVGDFAPRVADDTRADIEETVVGPGNRCREQQRDRQHELAHEWSSHPWMCGPHGGAPVAGHGNTAPLARLRRRLTTQRTPRTLAPPL